MSYFQSFIMGGFECSTHQDQNRRLDLIQMTQHDDFAKSDYGRLMSLGMATARDGLRWHRIEIAPGRYDFASLERQIAAVRETQIEVLWDLLHFGYPPDLDIFSEDFVPRFTDFAVAVSSHLARELGPHLTVCPINEISFFSWIAAEVGCFRPFAIDRSIELKAILVRAASEATRAIRSSVPTAKILAIDPIYHVVPEDGSHFESQASTEAFRLLQFEAFDRLLDVDDDAFDIMGLNYYSYNQWELPGRRTVPLGDPRYRPLREILAEYYDRYRRPLFISETGAEGDNRSGWFRYVCDEVMAAIKDGVPITGICLYPIVNHPGWADDRHCLNGLWDYPDDQGHREPDEEFLVEVLRQMKRFDSYFLEASNPVGRDHAGHHLRDTDVELTF